MGKRESYSGLKSPSSFSSLTHRLALLEVQSEFGTSSHLKTGIFHVIYGSPPHVEKLEDVADKDPTFPYTSQQKRPQLHKNVFSGDFPDGLVVKNLPCNAGDTGSIPGWGTKSPAATEQLSQHTTATEPMCCN